MFDPLEQLLLVADLFFCFQPLLMHQVHQLFLIALVIDAPNLLDAHAQSPIISDIQQLHNLINRVHAVAIFRIDLRMN